MKTINRNLLRTLPLLALAAVASQSLAQTQTQTQTQAEAEGPLATTIAIDCERRYITQSDAARVLRTDNFSQTYAKRQALYADVARACHRGVRQVLLVTDVRAGSQRTLASR